jgi:hypothetical protein
MAIVTPPLGEVPGISAYEIGTINSQTHYRVCEVSILRHSSKPDLSDDSSLVGHQPVD